MRVGLMNLPRSLGVRQELDSEKEKENTSPMEETAQTVVPPEVTFVIMLAAYSCWGRNTEERETPPKSFAKGSNLKLLVRTGVKVVVLDAEISSICKY